MLTICLKTSLGDYLLFEGSVEILQCDLCEQLGNLFPLLRYSLAMQTQLVIYSNYSPNCSQTSDPPASVSQVPGFQACATLPGFYIFVIFEKQFRNYDVNGL